MVAVLSALRQVSNRFLAVSLNLGRLTYILISAEIDPEFISLQSPPSTDPYNCCRGTILYLDNIQSGAAPDIHHALHF